MTIERFNAPLWEPVQAHHSMAAAWRFAKGLLMAGHRLVIEIRQEKRSDAENRLLHLLLGAIAKQKEWAGRSRDIEVWKRLLTAAWLRARGESIEVLPALDGHGIDVVFRRTSDLTRGECAELIEFVMSWMSAEGIEIPERPAEPAPPLRRTVKAGKHTADAETGEIMETA